MGPPMFPNCSYGVPGEGWDEWRKKMVRLGILGRRFQLLYREFVNWFITIRKVCQKTWNGHKNFFSHPNDSPVGLLRSHKSILWPYYSHVAWTFLKSYHSFKDGVLRGYWGLIEPRNCKNIIPVSVCPSVRWYVNLSVWSFRPSVCWWHSFFRTTEIELEMT